MHDEVTRAKVLDALATGLPVRAVSEQTGVSTHTIYGWKCRDKEFQQALRERQKEIVDDLRDQMPGLGQLALETYRRAARGEEISTAAYKAASDVLRSLGVIGDGAQHAIADTPDIQFIEIGMTEDGAILPLNRPGESVPDAATA